MSEKERVVEGGRKEIDKASLFLIAHYHTQRLCKVLYRQNIKKREIR